MHAVHLYLYNYKYKQFIYTVLSLFEVLAALPSKHIIVKAIVLWITCYFKQAYTEVKPALHRGSDPKG